MSQGSQPAGFGGKAGADVLGPAQDPPMREAGQPACNVCLRGAPPPPPLPVLLSKGVTELPQ